MQPAFNNPVAAFEFQPAQGVELCEGEAGNEVNRFGAFLASTADTSTEPGDQARSGKSDLFGSDLLAFQDPNLTSAAVAFSRQGAGLRRVRRGKNHSA